MSDPLTGRDETLEQKQGIVVCEGCDTTAVSEFSRKGRYPPRQPRLPSGWMGTGRSRKMPGLLAMWCPACEWAARNYNNPTAREVRRLIEAHQAPGAVARPVPAPVADDRPRALESDARSLQRQIDQLRTYVQHSRELIEQWRLAAQDSRSRRYNILQWQAVAVAQDQCAEELAAVLTPFTQEKEQKPMRDGAARADGTDPATASTVRCEHEWIDHEVFPNAVRCRKCRMQKDARPTERS